MDPEQLQIALSELAQVLGVPPPPPLTPDQIASSSSVISQLLAALAVVGNAGDPTDLADAEAGQAERELLTGAALMRFPANEAESTQSMQQLTGLAQQLPQALAGAGQAVGGIFGGFLQQLNQAMQEGVQAGQQLVGGLGDTGAELADDLPGEPLGDPPGSGGALLGAGGSPGGGRGGTAPAGNLRPPATPSAATFPASATGIPHAPNPAEPAGAARGGSGGYPMMPPGAMGGAGMPASDGKADTKRVVPQAVKNGAPVQGRVSAPPRLPEVTKPPEVTKRVDGRPVATRRIDTAGRSGRSTD